MEFTIKKDLNETEAELLQDLGNMLADGTVFEKDMDAAFRCFDLAAAAGCGEAMDDVGCCLERGIAVEQDCDGALEAYEDAAAHGYDDAWYHAGRLLCSGKLSGGADCERGFAYYEKAAEENLPYAKFAMAEMLLWGKGIPEDKERAFRLFEELHDDRFPDADFYVGLCWQEGWGVEPDYEKAHRYFRLGALDGDACCYNQLGVLYGRGLGVEQDNRAAFDYYSIAAEMDDPTACFNIAVFYERGDIGEEPDEEEAVKWYRRAAALGDKRARRRLEELGRMDEGKDDDEADDAPEEAF